MKNILAIIDAFGGLEMLGTNSISLKVSGLMPLSIERIGTGPSGGILISIMHWYEQNGDLMRDPDVVAELVPPIGCWLPISYQQDNLGIYQEAVYLDGNRLVTHSLLVDSIKQFLDEWDRNLGDQGFIVAAQAQALTRAYLGESASPGESPPPT